MSDSSDTATSQKGGNDSVTRRQKKSERVSTIESSDFKLNNLTVPTFTPDDPEIWFALLEGQFEAYGIKDDGFKFTNVITNLDLIHAKAVKDIILDPSPRNRYATIKAELIKRLTASHERKVKQLLTHEELGDRKASQFLRHLQDLAVPNVPKEFKKLLYELSY